MKKIQLPTEKDIAELFGLHMMNISALFTLLNMAES